MQRRAGLYSSGQINQAATAGDQEEGETSSNGGPEFTRILQELIRDGTVTVEEDDEDPDYVDIEGGEEEDADEVDEDIEMGPEEDDDDDEYAANILGYRVIRSTNQPGRWHDEVTEPKQEGLDLLFSGEFGRIQHQIRSRNKAGNAAKLLLNRGTKIKAPHREDFATVSASL